jgi:hypothetical protein
MLKDSSLIMDLTEDLHHSVAPSVATIRVSHRKSSVRIWEMEPGRSWMEPILAWQRFSTVGPFIKLRPKKRSNLMATMRKWMRLWPLQSTQTRRRTSSSLPRRRTALATETWRKRQKMSKRWLPKWRSRDFSTSMLRSCLMRS